MTRIISRAFAALALLLMFGSALMIAQPAAAADTGTGTVIWHFRACPPGAVDVVADCHNNPVGELETSMTDGLSNWYCTTPAVGEDGAGNCIYDLPAGGPYTAEVPAVTADPSILRGLYCSYEDEAGTDTFIDVSEGIYVEDGDVIICDVYVLDASMEPINGDDSGDSGDTGGDTALPETGVGAANGSDLLPLALVGMAVAGGLGVASRRRSVR